MAIIYQDGQPGKVCTKCQTWKPVEQFSKRSKRLDGYNSHCKDCHNAINRVLYWRDIERAREKNRAKQKHYARLEKHKARRHRYRQEHLEHLLELNRKHRRANPAYYREHSKQWRLRNLEKMQAKDSARRAFKMGQPGSFTAEEWQELKQRYNFTCLCCGRREPEIKLTVDHVVPISKGGASTIENIQPLCKTCNSAKNVNIIDYRLNWKDPQLE